MLLVTTAIEQTWGSNEDIIFLGEWCKVYNRKEIWSKRNHSVLPYHWNDRVKLKKDFIYLQNLNKTLLTELTLKLNEIHKVNYSERYWNLLLGYWLNLFTGVIFDRWTMINIAEQSGNELKYFSLGVNEEEIVANDNADFNYLIYNDFWNQAIYSKLIQNWTDIPLRTIDNDYFSFPSNYKPTNDYYKISFKKIIKKMGNQILPTFSKSVDALFHKTYLPWRSELKIQLKLGQLPIIRNKAYPPQIKYDISKRGWLLDYNNINNKFEKIVRHLIPLQLPRVFVEGHVELNKYVNNLNYPSKPRFIFTSVSHFSDICFQTWAAKKIEDGVDLITIDHGGFGTNAFNGAVNFQLAVSDTSLSWGWKDEDIPNIKPFAIIKTIGKRQKWDPTGFGLLVQLAMPRYSFDIRSMTIGEQMLNYFENQYFFYSKLPKSVQKDMIIRLYPEDYSWKQKNRWRDRFPDVKLENDLLPIYKSVEKSRLFISTYNATTYLESLSMNVPTIMFWDPYYWELHNRAIPYFKKLEKAGIFHKTPESAAKKVVEIWDNIPEWWNQKDIQDVREEFCHNFARKVEKPVSLLKTLLESASK